jgi:bifunctional non-homologous end joining protein LigD
MRQRHFVIDGEAVVLAVDDISDFAAPFEQGEIGPDLFRAACNMGLEGLVSKRPDRPYRAGRSPHWIKVKNPAAPAMTRAKGIDWSKR